jgi:inorganic triphosphatase YgiF
MNPTEVELKLLLPGADPATIEQTLSSLPALAGSLPQRQWLWNRYYDTAAQDLRRQRSALRLRCVSQEPWPDHDPAQPPAGEWIQTFKTAGVSQGGLSRRGEWESKVASGTLDQAALDATPWKDLDPKGELFEQLQPCFDTRCRRTTWLLQLDDGSRIEVALDVGSIAAAGRDLPLLELELELQAGMPGALFGLAQQIAASVAVLPCDASKAERGYALAQGVVHAPARARAVHLPAKISPLAAAQQAMGGMLEQLTRNLAGLLHADDPELVHQARVAWRRWRSAERLFRPWLSTLPARTALRPLLETLGRLRDLDVACTETLPAWLEAYAGGKAQRRNQAGRTLARLQLATQSQRHLTRQLLAQPGSGQGLLQLAHWLHELGQQVEPDEGRRQSERDWARERSARLLRRLRQAVEASAAEDASEAQQHRTRLLAKRVRYGVETLHDLLPQKKAGRWARQASQLQNRLGAERDLLRAIALLQEIGEDGSLTDFLRGVAAAHRHG